MEANQIKDSLGTPPNQMDRNGTITNLMEDINIESDSSSSEQQ